MSKPITIDRPHVINIDRSVPFVVHGWTIDEQDERAITLTEIDFSKVRQAGLRTEEF